MPWATRRPTGCAIDFIDNTDPDGIARTLRRLAGRLAETLCVVASKSGGTPETRNGMLLVAEAYQAAGLDFRSHAVAITMPGSKMDQTATAEGWLARFPMYDWVGGRTSELSAVGLLPAALQGLDIDGLLAGAAACDEATRRHEDLTTQPGRPDGPDVAPRHRRQGPEGHGRAAVQGPAAPVQPLPAATRHGVDRQAARPQGQRVDQGLTVYGNKGSTDQHAYVQQLREGVPNFFAVFIRVLEDGGSAREVEPGATAGDYLHGFLLGTRAALYENGRESMTITVPRVEPGRSAR